MVKAMAETQLEWELKDSGTNLSLTNRHQNPMLGKTEGKRRSGDTG